MVRSLGVAAVAASMQNLLPALASLPPPQVKSREQQRHCADTRPLNGIYPWGAWVSVTLLDVSARLVVSDQGRGGGSKAADSTWMVACSTPNNAMGRSLPGAPRHCGPPARRWHGRTLRVAARSRSLVPPGRAPRPLGYVRYRPQADIGAPPITPVDPRRDAASPSLPVHGRPACHRELICARAGHPRRSRHSICQ